MDPKELQQVLISPLARPWLNRSFPHNSFEGTPALRSSSRRKSSGEKWAGAGDQGEAISESGGKMSGRSS